VKSLIIRYRSFKASGKRKIIEGDYTEIGLLEENSVSAKVAYVFDEEMNNFFRKKWRALGLL
jgi:hypothetical protein